MASTDVELSERSSSTNAEQAPAKLTNPHPTDVNGAQMPSEAARPTTSQHARVYDSSLQTTFGTVLPAPLPEAHRPRRRQQVDDFYISGPSRQSTLQDTIQGELQYGNQSPNVQGTPAASLDIEYALDRPSKRSRWKNIFRRTPDPIGVTEIRYRDLEHVPNGYPRLAAFMDSNDSFMQFQRFGFLQARLLLDKQARLLALERELEELDWDDYDMDPRQLMTTEPGNSRSAEERHRILSEAEKTFREYAELMTAAQTLRSFDRPTDRDYKMIRRYLHNEKPLMDADMDCLRSKDDLVALRPPKEPDWLECQLEKCVYNGKRCINRLFRLAGSWSSSIEPTPTQYANVATAIVAFMMAVLLVLPVLICYLLVANIGGNRGYAGCIGVLFLFTLIFSCSMAFYSKAKRHEVLAATAAYCAVIVVFLGNAAQK